MGRHPTGLLVIIGYKTFTATILTLTAIAILLSLKNYAEMQSWAEDLVLAGRQGIVKWLVENVLQVKSKTVVFVALGMFFYAALSALEAVGLWYEKAWGRWLILISIGISIPVEIYELSKGFSWMKLVVFLLNLVIFAYVLLKFPKHHGEGRLRTKS
jgi:uncharacterized membrane protein (DUF2068 family)